jgi:cytosine/adenosine deaminase-related metal-dependent hydrolase
MLVVNGTLLTFGSSPRIIENGALRIQGDRISEVSATSELRAKYPGEGELDARGELVMSERTGSRALAEEVESRYA